LKPSILLLVIIFTFVSFLSGSEVEELRQALANAPEEAQADLLNQLAGLLLKSDPEQAISLARNAQTIAAKYKQDASLALSEKLIGNYHYQKKNFTAAIEAYSSAIIPARKTNDNDLLGDIHNNLGQCYLQNRDYAKAEQALLKALSHRKKLEKREDEISTCINLGSLFWQWQSYQQAVQWYQTAAKLLEASPNIRLASANYNNLGNAYVKTGEAVKALDAYIHSLELKEKFGSPAEIAASQVNIGNLFYQVKEYDKAISYYEKAQAIYLEAGDYDHANQIEGNIGVINNALNNFEDALQNHQKALSYFQKTGMKQEIAKTLNNLGNLFQYQKQYQTALDYYSQSIAIKTELKDLEGLATTHKNMGEIHYLLKDFPAAQKSTEASIKIAKQLNDRILLCNNYSQLSRIHEGQGDFQNALLAHKEYTRLDAALYKEESRNVLAEMMVRFDTQERTKEIIELKTVQKSQREKLATLAREKLIYLIFAAIVLTIALIVLVLYRQKRQEIKKRIAVQNELELLNQELEERVKQEMEKYQAQHQILIQRSKLESLGVLAAGIAHEINQPLSAISMSLDNLILKTNLGLSSPEYQSQKCNDMQSDIERIRQIIDHVRLFSRDQKDSALEQVDVNDTLRGALSIIDPALRKSGIETAIELCPDQPFILGNRYKLEQVLLNLLSNARDAILEKVSSFPTPIGNPLNPSSFPTRSGIQQIHPKIISLSTGLDGTLVSIRVKDTGIGIPPEKKDQIFDPFFTTKAPDQGTGLGLSISYGIIREMGGNISFESKPPDYTIATITLPLLRSQHEPM